MAPFFKNIYQSIETKGWVDIENEYYNLLVKYAIKENSKENLSELNQQLQYIQGYPFAATNRLGTHRNVHL